MTTILTPDPPNPESFRDATAAVDRLTELYQQATTFLHDAFAKAMETSAPGPGRRRRRFRTTLPSA